MTFLIADDNARMRDAIRRHISRNVPDHHVFIEASEGQEAVDLYSEHDPDWVLMDIEMQPMDGITALRRIRDQHPAARVIVVTAYDEAAYRAAAKKFGARGYVMKDHLDQIDEIMATEGKG